MLFSNSDLSKLFYQNIYIYIYIGTSLSCLMRNFINAVLNSFFIFNNKLYTQIDGLGMGLPLGQTFANIRQLGKALVI